MQLGRIALAAAAMLWLVPSTMAAPNAVGAAEVGLLAEPAEPTLDAPGAVGDSLERVGRGFVALSWRPGTLGDPDALIEQALVEAVDRAHRRVSPADLDAEPGDAQPTLTALDSGWDEFSTLTPEHQLRRLRQVANLLSERAPSSERVLEFDASVPRGDVVISARNDDMQILRMLKDTLKSVQNGTFFTPERLAIAGALLLALITLSRLRYLSGR